MKFRLISESDVTEMMFNWAKTNLFKSLVQSLDFSFSKDVSDLPSSVNLPGLFPLFSQKAILYFSSKYP